MGVGFISPYLIAIFIAWFTSHAIKFIVAVARGEKSRIDLSIFESGGMPSSHTATVVSLAVVIGLRDGFNTGLFSLAGLFAVIVAYDSLKVRRSSGEQGIALKKLINEQESKIDIPRISKGHTPVEVIAGAFFGAFIGIVVFLSTI